MTTMPLDFPAAQRKVAQIQPYWDKLHGRLAYMQKHGGITPGAVRLQAALASYAYVALYPYKLALEQHAQTPEASLFAATALYRDAYLMKDRDFLIGACLGWWR